jgi:hypothetical protein
VNKLLHEWGFESLSGLLAKSYGFANPYFLQWQTLGAIAAFLLGFFRAFVFDPPQAVFLLIFLLVADWLTGLTRALTTGERFDLDKFGRIVWIMLSHLFLMASFTWLGRVDTVVCAFLPLPIFVFLAIRTLLSVVKNMVALKWVRAEVLDYLEFKLLPFFSYQKRTAKSTEPLPPSPYPLPENRQETPTPSNEQPSNF